MNKKPNQLALLPIYLLLLDLAFGVLLNIKDAILPAAQNLPQDGLPISPDFAFGWLQVLVNLGMVIVIVWAIIYLIFLYIQSHKTPKPPFSFSHTVALLVVIVFSLPAWWHGFWAMISLFKGQNIIDWHNPRYFVITLCQAYLLWLPLVIWQVRRRRDFTDNIITPDASA